MPRRISLIALLVLFTTSALAKTYKMDGVIGGKYPIVIEIEEDDEGFYFGRYAYKSTLQKYGSVDCSWLDIMPGFEGQRPIWYIRDCNLNNVETWYDIRFNDGKHFTAKMKNVKGNVYDIVASVTEATRNSPSMASYFKEHIGDSPYDFRMFFDPSIQRRFENMMGEDSFNYMVYIYQTQGGIEYRKGMYYGTAFKAHECCDPATVWAYDVNEDVFYVWIRKDSRDYWWSESGNIPIKFQELVSDNF